MKVYEISSKTYTEETRRERIQKMLKRGYSGTLAWVDEKDGWGKIVITLPNRRMSEFEELAGINSSLSTLADEAINTIVDSKEREAFRKFVNLLIEKVEKK